MDNQTLNIPIPPPQQQTQTNNKKNLKWYNLVSNSLNVGTSIFIIILVNSFTTKKYINRATEYTVEAELLYLNITLGLFYSTVFSGSLNLIKNISLSQLFMLSFLIQTYKLENIGMVCFVLAMLLGIFMGLKLQNSYKFIPRCVLVGAKITMNFLLVFQMLFNLTLDSKPPFVLTIRSYLNYFLKNFQTFPYSLMVIFSSCLMWIYLIQKRHRRFPFVFVIFIMGILWGYFAQNYMEIENIQTYEMPNVFKLLYDHIMRKTETPRDFDITLLQNPNFLLHCTLYSGLVFIEFIISISLLKHSSQKESQCEREIWCMILANLFHGFLGLFPVSAGFDINMQVQAVNGHQKKYFAFGLLILLAYPLGLQSIIKFLPLIILATLFGSLSLQSHKSTDFSYLWRMNKKSFVFIFIMMIISIDHETCLAVFYATIIYYFFYLRSTKSESEYYYKIETVNNQNIQQFMNASRIQVGNSYENNNYNDDEEEEEQFVEHEEFNLIDQIKGKKTLLYTFYGNFNFFLEHLHYNNILLRDEELIVVNLEHIHKEDADFLAEYYEIIKLFEKAQKEVLILGLKYKYFTNQQIYDQGWILDYQQNNKIIFLNRDEKIEDFVTIKQAIREFLTSILLQLRGSVSQQIIFFNQFLIFFYNGTIEKLKKQDYSFQITIFIFQRQLQTFNLIF